MTATTKRLRELIAHRDAQDTTRGYWVADEKLALAAIKALPALLDVVEAADAASALDDISWATVQSTCELVLRKTILEKIFPLKVALARLDGVK